MGTWSKHSSAAKFPNYTQRRINSRAVQHIMNVYSFIYIFMSNTFGPSSASLLRGCACACVCVWGKGWDWRLLAGGNLKVPQCIDVTAVRPDVALYSECQGIVYFIESTIPFEDAIEEAFERKKLKYCGTGSGSKGTRLESTHKTRDKCGRLHTHTHTHTQDQWR